MFLFFWQFKPWRSYKQYNDELTAEKEQEEHVEAKIRQLRKLRNESRLVPLKREQENTKRQKLNENNDYVTIQEVWGRPQVSEPRTRTPDEHQSEPKNKKCKTQENERTQSQYMYENSGQNLIKLRNIETLNNIVEGPEENLELEEKRDWDKVLREHKQRIEQEEQEKTRLLDKQRKKTEGWKLYNLWKSF